MNAAAGAPDFDPDERVDLLLRDLRASREGLSQREADRRLLTHGQNQLEQRQQRSRLRELSRQVTHPLALLLWGAAALAALAGITPVAVAVVIVIVLNAGFAFVQEVQAERAVDALQGYLPPQATVIREGQQVQIEAINLVPGDLLVIEEGDRISADGHLLEGTVNVDLSTLTGESEPVTRSADARSAAHVPLLQASDLVFSGTNCTGGNAHAVVFATGMETELGRIAALSQRVKQEESPLERQVRRVAWLIAGIAVLMGIAFLPLATLVAGLSISDSVVFAIGLIVGNVPEGLLPVITLALAVGVRELVRQGAVVKRLSAVETLGSTDVICTDKTGTLTENRMRVTRIWTTDGEIDLERGRPDEVPSALTGLATAMAACNNARFEEGDDPVGDPTEAAMLSAARLLGHEEQSRQNRRAEFTFDPVLKRMSTVDSDDGDLWVNAKGAPEAIVGNCSSVATSSGPLVLEPEEHHRIEEVIARYADEGLRVLAVARRRIESMPSTRDDAESDLTFLGLVAMMDPPRAEVAGAVVDCRNAGIRIVVITGDHPRTAIAVARRIGIAGPSARAITGETLESMSDSELDAALREDVDLVFARSTPEAKLRIADALRAQQHVVAMTGDGVNDAPALRSADIGVAMGRSGTDVAREASTMVLTDDNFATIVAAIAAGRRIYDNIRKFIFYIFAHAPPEIAPFVVFALGGGDIPLPLTVLLLLTFDVGTETLPALALGREAPEPGLMRRPPRRRSEGIVRRSMLIRAWLFVGMIAAVLEMAAFFYVLIQGGWSPGDPTGNGTPLHHLYQQAVTMTFLSMIACQIGTAFAARTERASLRSIGVFSNSLLLWGVAFELALAGVIIYVPFFQELLGTAALPIEHLLLVAPFPFIVWGADEIRRWLVRRSDMRSAHEMNSVQPHLPA